MTNTITIEALAAEFNMEPFAVAAALDIDYRTTDEVDADFGREVLTIMADQEADRA